MKRRDLERHLAAQALQLFVAGLKDQSLDPRLRVKRFRGHAGIWEMSWPPTVSHFSVRS